MASARAQRELVAQEEAMDTANDVMNVPAGGPPSRHTTALQQQATTGNGTVSSQIGPAPYNHIADSSKRNSKHGKENNSVKHFAYYLKNHREFKPPTDLDYEDITHDLMGGFMHYLANDAHQYCNPEKELLMFNSTLGYASAAKGYIINKFRDQDVPACLKPEHWSKLLFQMTSTFYERARRSGDPLVNPHEASTPEDREALATMCVWKGDASGAEFFFLNTAMMQCVGRGSEVAASRKKDLSAPQQTEPTINYEIINHYLQHHKNNKDQDLSIFPHRVSVVSFLDYCIVCCSYNK
jgi:hypothetical protein